MKGQFIILVLSIINMKKFFFFLLIVFVLFSPNRVWSQFSLSVSPQKLDLILFPGDIYEGKIKITNHNTFSLPLSIKTIPFGAKEGTGEMEFEKIENNSPVFWFSFEKEEMILEPNETKRVNFKIEVPKDVPPAGYYVFIYLEPRFLKEQFKGSGPKIIPIVGIPVLISTSQLLVEPEKGKEIEILTFSIPEKERIKFLEKSLNFAYEKLKFSLASLGVALASSQSHFYITKDIPSSFFITVKNNDIYHLKTSGKIIVLDIFGKKIGEGEIKEKTILPQKTRDFEIQLTQKDNFSLGQILSFLLLGKTKVKIEMMAESPVRGDIFLSPQNSSFSFFSLRSLYFILIFIIIFLTTLFVKKRIYLFFKILIKPTQKEKR